MIIHWDFLRFQSCREICNRYLISIKSSQRSLNSEIDKRVGKNRIQSNVNHGNSNVIIFIDLHLSVSTLKINLYLRFVLAMPEFWNNRVILTANYVRYRSRFFSKFLQLLNTLFKLIYSCIMKLEGLKNVLKKILLVCLGVLNLWLWIS